MAYAAGLGPVGGDTVGVRVPPPAHLPSRGATVSPGVCRGLRMAVRAQQPQVLRPVIEWIAINVVHVQCQWRAPPRLTDPAFHTDRRDPDMSEKATQQGSPSAVGSSGTPHQEFRRI